MKNIAEALRACLISPNVPDGNWEAANVVDVIDKLARAVQFAAKHLGTGDASTPMGAIEAHAKELREGAVSITDAIRALADAQQETARTLGDIAAAIRGTKHE